MRRLVVLALAASMFIAATTVAAGVTTTAASARPGQASYRLTMAVTMIDAGDVHDGPGNTQDEIYFAVTGLTRLDGIASLRGRHTVRPQLSRDFWAMGADAATEFRTTIFEGPLGADDIAVFGVLFAEQDNRDPTSLVAGFTLATTNLVRRITSDLADGAGLSPRAIGSLGSEVIKLGHQMMTNRDELLGAVEIVVRGDALTVGTPDDTSSLLVSSSPATSVVNLRGAGGRYRVEFVLEDQARARPITQTFLARESGECEAAGLYVERRGGGMVQVRKGNHRVAVPVAVGGFLWQCGKPTEPAVLAAPRDTGLVMVTRHASDGAVTWDCYHQREAEPQYRW